MNQRIWIAAGLVAMLAGCGASRESQLTGSWHVRPASLGAMNGAAKGAPAAQQGAAAMFAKTTLDLRADKTFTLNLGAPMEGTWAMNPDATNADLQVTKIAGQDFSKMPNAAAMMPKLKMSCGLSEDGKRLSLKSAAPGAPGGVTSMMDFEKQ